MLSGKARVVVCWLLAALCAAAGFLLVPLLYQALVSARPAMADSLTFYLFNAIHELLVFALPALLILCARPVRWTAFKALRKPLSVTVVGLCALLGVASTVVFSMITNVWMTLLEGAFGYVSPPQDLPMPRNAAQWAGALLAVAVLPAVCEELFFRALLQRGLDTKLPRAGVWIAAAIFAGAHLRLEALPALLLIGLTLGYLMRRRGLLCAMLFHGLYNAAVLVLSSGEAQVDIVAMLLCAVAFWLALRRLMKKEETPCA